MVFCEAWETCCDWFLAEVCIVLATVSGVDGFDLCVAAGFLMDHSPRPKPTEWSAADTDRPLHLGLGVPLLSAPPSHPCLCVVCCVYATTHSWHGLAVVFFYWCFCETSLFLLNYASLTDTLSGPGTSDVTFLVTGTQTQRKRFWEWCAGTKIEGAEIL